MADLLIPNVEGTLLDRLKQRATAHGATAETEARSILAAALDPQQPDVWGVIDAILAQLAASGSVFDDSTELIRKDRDR